MIFEVFFPPIMVALRICVRTFKFCLWSSTQGPQLFSTINPSVKHQKTLNSTPKSLSSTPKTPHFHTPPVPHQKPSLPHSGVTDPVFGVELRSVWNWGLIGVELRGVLNWEFLVWIWGILSAEKLWSLCGTDVLNWGVVCGTEGYSNKLYRKYSYSVLIFY